MKKLITILFVVIAAICTTACSSEPSNSQNASGDTQASEQAQSKSQNDGVSIAAFVRGAGPDQAAAKAFKRGIELAVEAKTPASMKTIVLDRSQGAAEDAFLKSLLGTVPLVVYWQTADLTSAESTLKQSDVIAVPVWNVTKKVASLGTNVFGFGYSTERSFAEYAKFAGSKLKSYRHAILSSSSEPFSTQSKAFIEETKSQGNTVVFEEKAESVDTDFKSIIDRAKKENCDTIFAALPSDAIVAFVKAARAASYAGKILVGDSLFSAEREALGKDADGIYILQAWSDDATLKTKYVSKYGTEPDGVTLGAVALGFDLIQCIESVGSDLTSSTISYAWLSTPCEGLTGKTQFSGERIAQRKKRILTVKGEKFELTG